MVKKCIINSVALTLFVKHNRQKYGIVDPYTLKRDVIMVAHWLRVVSFLFTAQIWCYTLAYDCYL